MIFDFLIYSIMWSRYISPFNNFYSIHIIFCNISIVFVPFTFNGLSFKKWWHMLVVIVFNQVVMHITFTLYFLWLTCEMDEFHLFLLLTWHGMFSYIYCIFSLFAYNQILWKSQFIKENEWWRQRQWQGKIDTLCWFMEISCSLVLVQNSPSPKKGRPWCHCNRSCLLWNSPNGSNKVFLLVILISLSWEFVFGIHFGKSKHSML